MKYINKLSFFIGMIFFVVSIKSFAFGVGVAVNGKSSIISIPVSYHTIVFPFEVAEDIIIEPYFNYKSHTDKGVSGNKSEVDTLIYGLGVMMAVSNKKNATNFIGVKLGKIDSDFKSTFYTDKYNLVELTPYVGFKYEPTVNYSVGFEIGVTLYTGEYTDSSSPGFDTDIDGQELYTAIVLHYYFGD